jgi:hypothetical protein
MRWWKKTVLAALAGLMLIGFAAQANAQPYGRGGGCRRGDRLFIQDLDMSPDPVIQGQRVRNWIVKIRFDGDRQCETDIEVREGNDLVGRGRYTLRPGVNEIQMQPAEGHRLRGREHCFTVTADLEGTRRPVDADRQFCARQLPAWSLREWGDRGGPAAPPYGGPNR